MAIDYRGNEEAQQRRIDSLKKAEAKKWGEWTDYTVFCHRCQKEFVVRERDKSFPSKERYYCSSECSHSRQHSAATKKKISQKQTGRTNPRPLKGQFTSISYCDVCNRPYRSKKGQEYFACDRSCIGKHPQYKENMRQAKLNSDYVPRARSANEILFAELCKAHYNTVLTNEKMFDGWDADVIIEDLKVAVLWNGIWHYEQMFGTHSLKQVQNRDRLKIKEIEKAGYTAYIIKDMGKRNEAFVEEQFKIMQERLVPA